MTGRGHRRRERGMTLVELLVALTLLGMLSLMMAGGLSFGVRSWERTEAHSDRLNAVVRLHAFLRARLSEAARPGSVHGDGETLAFSALWPTAIGGTGFFDFSLARAEDGEDGAVVLSWAPAAGGEDAAPPDEDLAGERTMLPGTTRLAVSFFGRTAAEPEPRWHERWEPGGEPPALVRVDVTVAGAGDLPPLSVGLPGWR